MQEANFNIHHNEPSVDNRSHGNSWMDKKLYREDQIADNRSDFGGMSYSEFKLTKSVRSAKSTKSTNSLDKDKEYACVTQYTYCHFSQAALHPEYRQPNRGRHSVHFSN